MQVSDDSRRLLVQDEETQVEFKSLILKSANSLIIADKSTVTIPTH